MTFVTEINMKTKVVHCMREEYDVYIGRPGIWGNPYAHKSGTQAKYVVGSVTEAIEKYREYIMSKPDLLRRVPELKGKILGCWCKSKPNNPCHGDILVELAEQDD